jgi:glutathione S-transferase
MLNQKERQRLTSLAGQGPDEEQLVSFYDQYSTGQIQDATYFDHLSRLFEAFSELNDQLEDGRRFLMSDELSIADAFWSMKILRLTECGYPVEEHHPAVHAWYERVSARPSFQNEVMGKNRLTNLVFRAKSKLEGAFGKGLKQAVQAVAA